MYLNCQVTSHDHLIEGLCTLMSGNSLRYFTALIALVTISIVIVEV